MGPALLGQLSVSIQEERRQGTKNKDFNEGERISKQVSVGGYFAIQLNLIITCLSNTDFNITRPCLCSQMVIFLYFVCGRVYCFHAVRLSERTNDRPCVRTVLFP